jgi:hypothetical protein
MLLNGKFMNVVNNSETTKLPIFLVVESWAILDAPMSENKNVVEILGCIVCARTFNVLAVYTPGDSLLDCKVTNSGGHCVPGEQQPLVACDTYAAGEIENAYKRWQSRYSIELTDEQEDE